jgi:hypothetical protein
MNDTGTLEKGEEYSEMGATLVNAGFPNEAKVILERGMAANVFDAQSKSRAQATSNVRARVRRSTPKNLPTPTSNSRQPRRRTRSLASASSTSARETIRRPPARFRRA